MHRPLNYPAARTEDRQETVSGVSFPDPYRWLEDDTEETAAWQRDQNLLTDRFLAQWPHFARLRNWSTTARPTAPARRTGWSIPLPGSPADAGSAWHVRPVPVPTTRRPPW